MSDSGRVLVTGGMGLIGSSVVQLLRERGASVVVFDCAADAAATGGGDVRNFADVLRAARGCETVVHMAGIPGPELVEPTVGYDINARGSFVVFEAAATAGVRKVVYASSINANGLPLGVKPRLPSHYPYDEREPARIEDWYSLSKVATEDAARMVSSRYGLQMTGLRFPLTRNVMEADGAPFAAHLRRVMRDTPARAAAEGWSYIHVEDAARAVLKAIEARTPPAPGVLVAAPTTFLEVSTAEAVARYAPGVPSTVKDRGVGLDLSRSRAWLRFEATTTLEQVAPNAVISRREWDD